MPKMINGDAAFAKIVQIMNTCTARKFKNSEDSKIAGSMLKECAQVIIDAPEEKHREHVCCGNCVHWGRIKTAADTSYAKMCAVGGYMTGASGYCHFGKEADNAQKD